jgi:ketosteroid isomerase-like protein
MSRVFAVLGIALVSSACAGAANPDEAAARAAIAAATAATERAENAGNVEQMRPQMASDVVMMGPNMAAVSGAEAASAAMKQFFDAFSIQIQYSSEEIVVAGDLGYDRGTYRQTLTPKAGGTPMPESGKYLWIYRRDSDGSWKQSRVVWNSSDPTAPGQQ